MDMPAIFQLPAARRQLQLPPLPFVCEADCGLTRGDDDDFLSLSPTFSAGGVFALVVDTRRLKIEAPASLRVQGVLR